ncbi:Leucine-rich repeat-containing protein, partial [Cynara cardunculus var. scolymus]
SAVAGDQINADITIGFTEAERNGLLALKSRFHNPFLDAGWQSFNCLQWYGVNCSGGGVVGVTLENLGITGEIVADSLLNLTSLSVLSFKNNSIFGQMMDFSKNPNLARLDLSSNNFDGSISPSLVNLVLLESLQLQQNRLTGSIPWFDQSSLKQLNVSNNNLSGPIPNTKTLESFGPSSYDHNQWLCGPPSPRVCGPTTSDDDHSSGSNKSTLLIIVNVIGVFIIVILLVLFYKKKQKLDRKRMENKNTMVEEDAEKASKVMIDDHHENVPKPDKGNLVFVDGDPEFELGDLMKASAESLGKGNFGNTYRARLEDGRNVIVKRLRDLKPLSSDEFVTQMNAIAAQKHPNLTLLLAYYYSKHEKLLVHKLTIARGVARAMEYLHTNPNLQTLVPHGNLKSSNVLIDENNNALISGYGLTGIISNTISAQQMVAFKSPEFVTSKRISKKSDVWSYGTLVMELLTGRLGVHSAPQDDKAVDLCSWVHRAVREEWTAEIFDLEIMVQRSAIHGMLKLLQLAVRCCDKAPEKRPEMSEVARDVESIKVGNVDSESEEDLSVDRSLTDDSMSATSSR